MDRLVDAKLLGHAYFFIGLYECFMSYAMAFWYMQVGIHLTPKEKKKS